MPGYFVKFFGSDAVRESTSLKVENEVERALCHYACCFSIHKKPRQIKEGDIIYMARMMNPNDYAIFGRAEARDYNEEMDVTTEEEIMQRSWKKKWCIYLRLQNPVFINTRLWNCPYLFTLINELGYNSFPSTMERYGSGERNINPRRSLSKQAYVKLTGQANNWLEQKFNAALDKYGTIGRDFLDNLPNSERQY